jgi:hypothetical protein
MKSNIVLLNVGGKKFMTTKQTLSPCAFFAAAFSGGDLMPPAMMDNDGALFLDRSGERFEHILDFLRRGKISGADGFVTSEYVCYEEEADFYGLPTLRAYIIQLRIAKMDAPFTIQMLQTLWHRVIGYTRNRQPNNDTLPYEEQSIIELQTRLCTDAQREQYAVCLTQHISNIEVTIINKAGGALDLLDEAEKLLLEKLRATRNAVLGGAFS